MTACELMSFQVLDGRGTPEVRTLGFAETCKGLADAHREIGFDRLAGQTPDLGVTTVNPYWDVVRLLPTTNWLVGDPWAVEGYCSDIAAIPLRRSLVRRFAWSILSPADLAWLRTVLDGRAVVEIGAGSGYWAWQLTQAGITVEAFDNGTDTWEHHWHPVRKSDNLDMLGRLMRPSDPRALMLVWPPYNTRMAHAALAMYRGDLLVYAGEEDGCTADAAFREALVAGWTPVSESAGHATYEGIHCELSAFRRNPAAAP